MGKYVVALFCDLCKHSHAWNRLPRDQMAGLIGEYKALAEKVASQHGSFHANFTGDGHLFLFDNADAAVRFGLKLIAAWHEEFAASPALKDLPPIPLRVGAHFGEDTEIGNGEAWVGRANNMANRIEAAAEPDSLLVSEGMLDLIDFPLYEIESAAACELEGDCVAARTLYRVARFDEAASGAKPPDELSAEDWFLRAVAMIGTAKEGNEEEEHCYAQALQLWPEFAQAHYNYGVLLKDRGDLKGAEEHWAAALQLQPGFAEAHNNYGNVLRDRGDIAGAEAHYLEDLRLRPDNAGAHYNYADLLAGRNDVQSAEDHYLEALRLRPDYAEAHNNYGLLLKESGDAKHAEEHYLEALRLDPSCFEAHNNYGVLLHSRGDIAGAEEHYLEALRLRPDDAEAHSNYAILLNARGDGRGAEEHYLEALRLEPDYAIGHYNYATLLRKKGDVNGAEQHYRRAYELTPDEPDIKAAFEECAWES